MAKVQHVKAGKDHPQFGIKKGDMHFVWSMKMQRGGITRPKQSQLTLSEYKIAAHTINEQTNDLAFSDIGEIQQLRDFQQGQIDAASELRDEQQDKLDNMPEGLQQGSTGELLQERIDALESFISKLEGLDLDVEFEEDGEEEDGLNAEGQTQSEWLEALYDELTAIQLDVG